MGWKLLSGAIATGFAILKASVSAKDKAELLKRNEKLEADNAALRSKLSATRPFTDLFHKSDGYWTWDTDTLSVVDGPFCIPCYDKDQKLMRLTGAPGRRVCHVCNWKPSLRRQLPVQGLGR